MKKRNLLIVFLLINILLFTGCSAATLQSEIEAAQATQTPAESTLTIETTQLPSPVPVQTPGVPQDFSYDDSEQIIVKYRDEETQQEEEAVYEIAGDASNESALDAVNEVIFGEEKIKANSIIFSNGNLFIDFDESIYNMNLGSSGEGDVLEAIADSYLNNVQDIQAVYYSVNGEDYSSGHIIQSKDQPFKTRG